MSAGGIDFVDDTKATNPHAAVASAKSYPSVVLIAGGVAKGLDLSPLVDISTVRHIVAIGEAAASLPSVKPLDKAVHKHLAFPSQQTHIMMGQANLRRGFRRELSVYRRGVHLGGQD